MTYHPDDHAAVEKLHSEFINRFDRVNDDLMTFQDAAYAMGLKRGQGELQESLAREAALQQRLNEADQRLDEATQRVRESQAELLEMKASVGYRGFTLGVIGRNDHFLSQLTKDSPSCCVQTPEEKALLASGDYTPEELYGAGGKPSCPKCHKAAAKGKQLAKDSPEVGS